MLENINWLPTAEFACAAGISPQAARKVMRQALEGRPWRNHQLQVRRSLGVGGRGGLNYEVAPASLPDDLAPAAADALAVRASPSPAVRAKAAGQNARVLNRLDVIAPALGCPLRSAERAEAVRRASYDTLTSRRTLYRWLQQYEAYGLRGLARARPANAGQCRVVVSRSFDQAFRLAGYDEAVLERVAAELDKTLKGLWVSRAEQAGVTEVRRLAEFSLLELCEAKGLQMPASAIRISRRRVERFADYRVVNQRRNDRKAFDDARPRIRRDWTGLAPMERVVADVKHLDVIVTRPDGSQAWPKIVAFMDAGTGRVFVHPVLLERGEGVRQEHVIEGFLAMVSQPGWGFPQGLYLDNGSEFGALAKIDGALQLLNAPGARTLIYARPYNASAKPIESLFARLDRYVFGLLPGYAGPNRMAKKTQTVGKPPQPYPGSWGEFCATLQDLIAAHNLRPVGGPWDGRSPEEWFQDKVAAGWRPATVDPPALDAAFADPDSRRVDRGVLKIKAAGTPTRASPPCPRAPSSTWRCLGVETPSRWRGSTAPGSIWSAISPTRRAGWKGLGNPAAARRRRTSTSPSWRGTRLPSIRWRPRSAGRSASPMSRRPRSRAPSSTSAAKSTSARNRCGRRSIRRKRARRRSFAARARWR
jgi:hypothetical protein